MGQKETRDSAMVDEKQLMRLVDGEMSLEEQQSALRWLDAHPERWRDCALAFLEEQTLQQELATAGGRTATPVSADAAKFPEVGSPARHATAGPTHVTDASQGGTAAASESGWVKLISLAALVMAAFAVGWLMDMASKQQAPAPAMVVSPVPSLPVDRPPNDQQPQVVSRDPRSRPDAYPPFFVTDHRLWDNESALPPEIESRLEQLGADVRRERGVMPGRLPDGRVVNVPYEDIQVVPVSNHAY